MMARQIPGQLGDYRPYRTVAAVPDDAQWWSLASTSGKVGYVLLSDLRELRFRGLLQPASSSCHRLDRHQRAQRLPMDRLASEQELEPVLIAGIVGCRHHDPGIEPSGAHGVVKQRCRSQPRGIDAQAARQ